MATKPELSRECSSVAAATLRHYNAQFRAWMKEQTVGR